LIWTLLDAVSWCRNTVRHRGSSGASFFRRSCHVPSKDGCPADCLHCFRVYMPGPARQAASRSLGRKTSVFSHSLHAICHRKSCSRSDILHPHNRAGPGLKFATQLCVPRALVSSGFISPLNKLKSWHPTSIATHTTIRSRHRRSMITAYSDDRQLTDETPAAHGRAMEQ
jgi:hypothetical protein